MQFKFALVLTAPWLLAACGGGGGSSTLAPFVKFSSIAIPGSVRINGSSQQANYTFNNSTQKITSITGVTSFASGATFDGTYNASGNLTKAVFNSAAGTNITIDTARGDTFASSSPLSEGVTANGQNYAFSPIPSALGWDYQTFGVWTTGGGTGSGTVGALTLGAETAGAAIPTTGTGSFTGITMGQYTDGTGTPYYTVSNMSANANFGTRSIAFATTSSATLNQVTFAQTANSNLNMTGALTYSAGVNQFTGSVNSAGGGPSNAALAGTATGKFYGPAAQEIGGTFVLTNGAASYAGGFGGKR